MALGLDDAFGQLERRRHAKIGERRVGAFFGDEDGEAADLRWAEGVRPCGHAEVRRTFGDAPLDGLHALAPDQRRAGERRALGRALEAVAVADGAMLPVQAFERRRAALARRCGSSEAGERNNADDGWPHGILLDCCTSALSTPNVRVHAPSGWPPERPAPDRARRGRCIAPEGRARSEYCAITPSQPRLARAKPHFVRDAEATTDPHIWG